MIRMYKTYFAFIQHVSVWCNRNILSTSKGVDGKDGWILNFFTEQQKRQTKSAIFEFTYRIDDPKILTTPE